jgi:acetyl-CoA carboxylase carboxyl transferase subunit alpha
MKRENAMADFWLTCATKLSGMNFLEFEKPVQELLDQIEKQKLIGEKTRVDVSVAVRQLEIRLEETRRTLYSNLTPWQKVQLSRHPDRPYALSYIQHITEGNFVEMFGDRTVRDDKAIVGGLGAINGRTVMFIGQQKGNTTKQRQFRVTARRSD